MLFFAIFNSFCVWHTVEPAPNNAAGNFIKAFVRKRSKRLTLGGIGSVNNGKYHNRAETRIKADRTNLGAFLLRKNRAFRSNSSPPSTAAAGFPLQSLARAQKSTSLWIFELVEMRRSTAALRHHGAMRRALSQRHPCRPSMADFELVEVRQSTAALRHHGAMRRALSQRHPCRPSMADFELVPAASMPPIPAGFAACRSAAEYRRNRVKPTKWFL